MNDFDKSAIHIRVSSAPGLELRSAKNEDMGYIRKWKNAERQFFFHQEEISQPQQQQWFGAFKQRNYDLMLMTLFEGEVFGCMGIRWQAGQPTNYWDIYNVILGLPDYGKRGLMRKALAALLAYATMLKPAQVTLQVLKHNPAVGWYQKQGFLITETHETHFSMLYQTNYRKELSP